MLWGVFSQVLGVKFGIWKCCLCKINDKYQVCIKIVRNSSVLSWWRLIFKWRRRWWHDRSLLVGEPVLYYTNQPTKQPTKQWLVGAIMHQPSNQPTSQSSLVRNRIGTEGGLQPTNNCLLGKHQLSVSDQQTPLNSTISLKLNLSQETPLKST